MLHLSRRLSSYGNLEYEINPPAADNLIFAVEERLSLTIPTKVKQYYQTYDGFSVVDPRIELFSIKNIEFISGGQLLKFAQVYGQYDLCFDTAQLNNDEQWNIVTADGFVLTLTIGSFLANRLWGFIDSGNSDWFDRVLALAICRLGPVEAQLVWIFNCAKRPLPRVVFSSKDAAEQWINKHSLSGTLSLYPVDIGAYEYSIRNGHFMPKNKNQTSLEFIQTFNGSLDHYHYDFEIPSK